MNLKFSYPKKIIISFLSLFLAVFTVQFNILAETEDEDTKPKTEGIAISGAFSSQNIKMVAGERYQPAGVTLIIFNNFDEIADVRLTQTVVDENNEPVEGIIFDRDFDEIILIPARDTYEFPISFRVSDFMLPGKYFITIGAEVIPNQQSGIVAVPAVRQRARLEVFGEAGFVNFNLVDVFGEPFVGSMTLNRIDGNSKSEVASLNTSSYQDRLVPGEYEIIVNYVYQTIFYRVLLDGFTLRNRDELNLTFVVQTVFVNGLSLFPILGDDDILLNARIDFSVNNIYEVYEDVVVRVDVFFNGEFLETVDIQNISSLDLGSLNYRYNYVPLGGWRNGTYVFELSVIKLDTNEVVLTTSEPYTIFIDSMPGEALPIWVIVLGVSILIAFGVSFFVILRKKPNQDDIICLDDDPAYLEALSSLIEGGSTK